MTPETQVLKGKFYYDHDGRSLSVFKELTELRHPVFGAIYIRTNVLKGTPSSVDVVAEVHYD